MAGYLRKIFEELAEFEAVKKALERGEKISAGGVSAPVIAGLSDWAARYFKRPVLVLAPEDIAKDLLRDAEFTAGERALPFPAWDILPYEHQYPAPEIVAERIFALWRLRQTEDAIVVAPPLSLMWRTIPENLLEEFSLSLKLGEKVPPEQIVRLLERSGYHREAVVEYLQTYARRGDILDVFSPAHPDPVRVEFFGDEIDSIRFFSTRDQRSLGKAKSARILPATEWFTVDLAISEEEEKLSPLAEKLPQSVVDEVVAQLRLDRHFPAKIWYAPIFEPAPVDPIKVLSARKPIIVAVEPENLVEEISAFCRKARQLYERVLWEDLEPLPPENLFPSPEEIEAFLESAHIVIREIPVGERAIKFSIRDVDVPDSVVGLLELFEKAQKGGKVAVVVSSENQRARIEAKMGMRLPVSVVQASRGMLSRSVEIGLREGRFTLISGDNILGFSRAMFVPKKYHTGKAMLSHYGLSQGDYVVHSEYGIARFLGIRELEVNGRRGEYLELEFAGEEKLYVPMEDFYLVNPYLGPKEMVQLSRLGGTKWSATKLRAKKQIYELAGELMRIYATRQIKTRPPFERAPEWEEYVRATFPFEETPDQLRAIEEVFADMDSEHPMDRLLCGDVGFGKTEVAIRAAVRAVASGKQVAVLVPTTILALQHYETFSKRLSELPIRVEMLCRFTSPSRARKIKQDIAAGKVDIAIGTHMLLSDTVQFKDLGLLIIDEEQWFGVRHKEKLKSLRAEVDVLTMTATPIPRTLYFSISGLRDLSIIETPPKSRKPVFTQIVPWNMDLFRRAIYAELERDGQVFFIHNRVETIYGIAEVLRRAMPDVRFAVAHGQMRERELERIVYDFRRGEYDVLVCTAIIESGTDMPRVNTIIVDRADRFGLAQLYQLRGRVGRSDVQAYAYFVVPPYKSVSKNAKKRLAALLEYSDLGSGYNLALKDLEIRGAGNLLGREQSGFVAAVGLDLYSKMLAEAVAELKGQKPPIFEPIPFSIDFDAFIPMDYVEDTEDRIYFYQRLFTADREEKVERIGAELSDRFGRMPEPVQNLINFIRARILATRAGFQSVSFGKRWIALYFSSEKLSLARLNEALADFSPPLDFALSPTPAIKLPRATSLERDFANLLRLLHRVLEKE